MPKDIEIVEIMTGDGLKKRKIKYDHNLYKMPRVVYDKKTGRSFFRLKKKKIWVEPDISERQLIKFIIKQLAPKKRRAANKKEKEKVNPPKLPPSTGFITRLQAPYVPPVNSNAEQEKRVALLTEEIKKLKELKEDDPEQKLIQENALKLYDEMREAINVHKVPVLRKMITYFKIPNMARKKKAELVDALIRVGWDGEIRSRATVEEVHEVDEPKKNKHNVVFDSDSEVEEVVKKKKPVIVIESDSDEEQKGSGVKEDIEEYGMSNKEIDHVMKDYSWYLGTIPSDHISTLIPLVKPNTRVGFIMNSDPSTKPGEHWVAVLIDTRKDGSKSVEYYNPLGVTDRKRLTAQFLRDIIPVLEKMNPSDEGTRNPLPLKLKENLISDQNSTSSNCGPFCIRFLLDRVERDKSFSEATNYDKLGEAMIEKWKDEFYPFKNLLQNGRGLLDYIKKGYQYVKGKIKNVAERVKDATGSLRMDYPPNVRSTIAKYGDQKVTGIQVCRKPIHSLVKKAMDWLSNGQFSENIKKAGYDDAMHLYCLVQLENVILKCEKNEVISITKSKGDNGAESVNASTPNVTFSGLLEKGLKLAGPSNWFIYDSRNNNCQKWIGTLLKANGVLSSELNTFIYQSAEKIYENLGLIGSIAKGVTDVAARGSILVEGRGLGAPRGANPGNKRFKPRIFISTDDEPKRDQTGGKYKVGTLISKDDEKGGRGKYKVGSLISKDDERGGI